MKAINLCAGLRMANVPSRLHVSKSITVPGIIFSNSVGGAFESLVNTCAVNPFDRSLLPGLKYMKSFMSSSSPNPLLYVVQVSEEFVQVRQRQFETERQTCCCVDATGSVTSLCILA